MKKTNNNLSLIEINAVPAQQPQEILAFPKQIFELNERQRLLQVIDQANEIASLTNLDDLVSRMVDLMIEVVEAESATYFQRDLETDELVVRNVRGDEESQYLVGLRIQCQGDFFRKDDWANIPIVIENLINDSRWLRVVNPARAVPLKNAILLPLVTKDQVLGMVQIYNFNLNEVDLLHLLGNQLSLGIVRLQSLLKEQRSNQRLYSLLDVVGRLGGTVDQANLMRIITEAACSLVNAGRSSVFLMDPDTKEMIFHASYQADSQPKLVNPEISAAKRTFQSISKNNETLSLNRTSPNQINYFSPNAITVPISSNSGSEAGDGQPQRSLGGVMVFTNSEAHFQEDDFNVLEILAQQASTFLRVADLHDNTAELFVESITALVAAIDAKDPYTQGHSQRVSEYSLLIGREVGLNDTDLNNLRIGSLFHDVGKIGIPDSILLSSGKLSPSEWEIVKRHPLTGMNILSKVKMLAPSLPAVVEHHEHLDGSGYPSGLKGKQISLQGRIVAVADVFDAMTSNRPYRQALTTSQVFDHLRLYSGKWYDGIFIDALARIILRNQ